MNGNSRSEFSFVQPNHGKKKRKKNKKNKKKVKIRKKNNCLLRNSLIKGQPSPVHLRQSIILPTSNQIKQS